MLAQHLTGRVALAGAVYLCVTILSVGFPTTPNHVLLGIGDDPKSSVWFLEWWPWAILHGRDPFWSHFVFSPGGYSMGWATSVPTASLLAAPVTLTVGPVVSFNLLTFVARPLAALCGFLLAFELTGGAFAASLVAGSLYGFSGYENGQALGHLNLDLVFLLPIAVLLFVKRVRGSLNRTSFIGSFSCILLAQFGLSTEIFATALIAGLWAVLTLIAFGTPKERSAIAAISFEAGAAVAIAFASASPFLLSMLAGAADLPNFVNPALVYSNDLLNLIVPTMAEAIRPSWTEAFASHFSGNAEEQDLYLGLPLVLMLVLALIAAPFRRRAAWTLVVTGLVLASLGPALHIGGRQLPFPLPWMIAGRLPLLRGALPCRLGVFIDLAVSMIVATWLAGGARHRLGLGLAACLLLLPGSARTARTPVVTPCLFDPARIASVVPNGVNTLILPYGSGDSMLWQARAEMSLRQAGGLLSFVPREFSREPLVVPLLRNIATPGFALALRDFLRRFEVQRILVGPGTSARLLAALNATEFERESLCGMTIFEVPGTQVSRQKLSGG